MERELQTRDLIETRRELRTQCLRSIQIKATPDNPSGTGSGCGNVKGYMDSYGTIVTDGAFVETVDYLLTSGFLADGHGAAFGYHYPTKAEIGIFTDVREDKEGLQLSWEYHDDEHSQAVRQKTEKRLKNGKTCGMSIGFFVGDGKNPPVGWEYSEKEDEPDGIDYISITPQYYEDIIPIFSTPEYEQENLARAQQFPCVYILKRVHVFETSQTEIPANEVSLIAEVRTRRNQKNTTMAKKDDDAKAKMDAKFDDMKDALDGMKRDFKKAKETHADMKEKLDDMKDAHEEHNSHMAKLARGIKAMDAHLSKFDDDDDDETKSKAKDADEEDGKKSRVNKIYGRAN